MSPEGVEQLPVAVWWVMCGMSLFMMMVMTVMMTMIIYLLYIADADRQ
jgi:hypothetical protein